MQLLPHQISVAELRDLACAGLDLIRSGQYGLLVERYGYATALGRDPAGAVKADLALALSHASGSELLPVATKGLPVVLFQDNTCSLRAAIDCQIPTQGGRNVWISFVVTATDTEQFLSLEDICAEPGPE